MTFVFFLISFDSVQLDLCLVVVFCYIEWTMYQIRHNLMFCYIEHIVYQIMHNMIFVI